MTLVSIKHFYKAYHLDENGGIVRLELIEAVNDEDALEQVKDCQLARKIEVWDRSRRVGDTAESATPLSSSRAPAAVGD